MSTELEQRVEAGETLEPTDELTDEYRSLLAAMIRFTANTELIGAWLERPHIPHAPTYERRLAIIAKIQDEVGHAQMQYRLVEDITGTSRNELLDDLLSGRSGFGNAFQYEIDSWQEYAMFVWLADGGAMTLQHTLLRSSYGPYARVMRRICREEEFHIRYAGDIVRRQVNHSEERKRQMQELLNEWWPRGMLFFGHKDGESESVGRMMELGIRTKSNDECRQAYLDNFVPKIRDFGLEVPDPNVEYDEEAGRWNYSEPDWAELERTREGQGPLAASRVDTRREAFEEADWVRDALGERYRAGLGDTRAAGAAGD